MSLVLNFFFMIIAGFIYTSSLSALPADNKEKVIIKSDSSIYNYKTGINSYEGHVQVDQGSTHITADRLITKNNGQHKIREAIAYGLNSLAHYWTLQKVGEPELHAKAKIIKFYPIESNVTLEQDVTVTQGKNIFQGQLIHYNRNEETMTVPPSHHGRAVLVYHPDN